MPDNNFEFYVGDDKMGLHADGSQNCSCNACCKSAQHVSSLSWIKVFTCTEQITRYIQNCVGAYKLQIETKEDYGTNKDINIKLRGIN